MRKNSTVKVAGESLSTRSEPPFPFPEPGGAVVREVPGKEEEEEEEMQKWLEEGQEKVVGS